jgi:hypothetical protein
LFEAILFLGKPLLGLNSLLCEFATSGVQVDIAQDLARHLDIFDGRIPLIFTTVIRNVSPLVAPDELDNFARLLVVIFNVNVEFVSGAHKFFCGFLVAELAANQRNKCAAALAPLIWIKIALTVKRRRVSDRRPGGEALKRKENLPSLSKDEVFDQITGVNTALDD